MSNIQDKVSSLQSQIFKQYLENQYIFENIISEIGGEFKYLFLTTSTFDHLYLQPSDPDPLASTWVYRYRSGYDNQEGLFTLSFIGDDLRILLDSPVQNQHHRISIPAIDPLYQQWIIHLYHCHIELGCNPKLKRLYKKTLNIV